jgi:hypothetical protein
LWFSVSMPLEETTGMLTIEGGSSPERAAIHMAQRDRLGMLAGCSSPTARLRSCAGRPMFAAAELQRDRTFRGQLTQ